MGTGSGRGIGRRKGTGRGRGIGGSKRIGRSRGIEGARAWEGEEVITHMANSIVRDFLLFYYILDLRHFQSMKNIRILLGTKKKFNLICSIMFLCVNLGAVSSQIGQVLTKL